MPTEPRKPLIVISYAPADEPDKPAEGELKWMSFVTDHLLAALPWGAVDLWIDRLTPDGAEWEPEIDPKLRACYIFILLVSSHSLSSDDVVDKEMAIIRERQDQGEAVHFYPIVLTRTPKVALDRVRDKNMRPRDGRPLSDCSMSERDRHMSDVASEIAAIVAQIAAPAYPTAADHLELESLALWLHGQSPEAAMAIAARAALRVAPLVRAIAPGRLDATASRQLANWTAATFRANGLAWVAAKYPTRAKELRADAGAAARAGVAAADAAAAVAASAGYSSIRAAVSAALLAQYPARKEVACSPSAARAAAAAAADGAAGVRAELGADKETIVRYGAAEAAERPLWSRGQPPWAMEAWAALQADLPKREDWDAWIRWYEARLSGGSRGEAYEFVFASVPLDVWDRGPAAANAWIKAHLPEPLNFS